MDTGSAVIKTYSTILVTLKVDLRCSSVHKRMGVTWVLLSSGCISKVNEIGSLNPGHQGSRNSHYGMLSLNILGYMCASAYRYTLSVPVYSPYSWPSVSKGFTSAIQPVMDWKYSDKSATKFQTLRVGVVLSIISGQENWLLFSFICLHSTARYWESQSLGRELTGQALCPKCMTYSATGPLAPRRQPRVVAIPFIVLDIFWICLR